MLFFNEAQLNCFEVDIPLRRVLIKGKTIIKYKQNGVMVALIKYQQNGVMVPLTINNQQNGVMFPLTIKYQHNGVMVPLIFKYQHNGVMVPLVIKYQQNGPGHPDLDLALPQRQAHLLHHLQGQDQDHLQHQKKIEKEAGSLGQGNGNGSKGYIGKG